jgi:hypothetical protein
MFNNSLIAYPKNVDDCATSILRIAPNENMQCDQVSLSDRVPNVKFQVGIPTQAFFQRSHGCFGSVRDSWIVLNESGSHIPFKRNSGLFLDKAESAELEYDPFRFFGHGDEQPGAGYDQDMTMTKMVKKSFGAPDENVCL